MKKFKGNLDFNMAKFMLQIPIKINNSKNQMYESNEPNTNTQNFKNIDTQTDISAQTNKCDSL